MKNKGIRVVLAVILALVLLLGTVSFVEAKGNPNRTVSVTAIATLDGGTYDLSFHLSWYAYRIERISAYWWYKVGDTWVSSGIGNTYDLTKASRSYSSIFDYLTYNPQNVSSGEQWRIEIALYTPKGKDNYVFTVNALDEIIVGS